jgi:hypothetical protein
MRALAISVSLLLAASATARENLSSQELAHLKRVCSGLRGTQFLAPSWQKLSPYLRDRHALDSVRTVCSGSCSGSIPLRRGLWFDFVFVNPQKMGKPWGPRDGLVYPVTLGSEKRSLLHRETEPKT